MDIGAFYELWMLRSIVVLNLAPAAFASVRFILLLISYGKGEDISDIDDSCMLESRVVLNTKHNNPFGVAIDWALHACIVSAGALVWPIFYPLAIVFGIASIFRKKNLERKAILNSLKGTDDVN